MDRIEYQNRVAGAYGRMIERGATSRPGFHLTPLAGTLGDPNGLVQVGDTYHVFFLNTPLACETTDRTPCVWVHLSTEDFITWRNEPVAIWPDCRRDRDGAYSGSALLRDGELHLFYTGNVRHAGDHDYITSGREQNVMRVTSRDMRRFGNKELLMTTEEFPAEMTQHVRDPQVVTSGGATYVLLGARTRRDEGCALVYRLGEDATSMELVGTVRTPEPFGYMWECPDLLELGGHTFLLCCPQGVAHEAYRFQCAHQCGRFELSGGLAGDAEARSFEQWDYGFDFYAARTLKARDRILLIGWMGMPDAPYGAMPDDNPGWDQVLAMPRELVWQDGRICQRPLGELALLRGPARPFTGETVLRGRRFELDIDFASDEGFELALREDCTLSFAAGELVLRMGPACGAGRDERRVRLAHLDRLQVFVDDTTLEVFVNDGALTLTSRLFGASDTVAVRRLNGSGTFWEMGAFRFEL